MGSARLVTPTQDLTDYLQETWLSGPAGPKADSSLPFSFMSPFHFFDAVCAETVAGMNNRLSTWSLSSESLTTSVDTLCKQRITAASEAVLWGSI